MEQAITFSIAGELALGILHTPEEGGDIAVLIIVGGPQYRIGSHRQFIQLSRFLADHNISSFRFDYRGMGDTVGSKVTFDQIDVDTKIAIDTFFDHNPKIKKVVIWGLCDAASAALMYGFKDPRICGLVLLNPWLENDQAKAKTMVKFYYFRRLLSLRFWRRLFHGNVQVLKGVKEAGVSMGETIKADQHQAQSYQERMCQGAEKFAGRICLILSGNDLTAREFKQQIHGNAAWKRINETGNQYHFIEQADHTFSSIEHKEKVARLTCDFIKNLSELRDYNHDQSS